MSLSTRRQALAEVTTRFVAKRYPRLIVSLILGLSGLAAFGVSAASLRLGVDAMWIRYLGATIAGYATFLLLIRVWIAFHREEWFFDYVPDFGGATMPAGGGATAQAGFSGGASGGGGATGNWGVGGSQTSNLLDATPDVDVDDAWPILLAIVLALGALVAMFYVIYAAPALLAEVALDAALVTGIYRKVRKQDLRHWLFSAVRHTWLPAIMVAICMALAGAVLQGAVPTARSIGDIVRAVDR